MGSLGMPEILMILVIALIVFGPRKLPELGKTLGQSLAQFRKASEDFKRQWEDEVAIERQRIDAPPPAPAETVAYQTASNGIDEHHTSPPEEPSHTVAASDPSPTAHHEEAAAAPQTKRDWM